MNKSIELIPQTPRRAPLVRLCTAGSIALTALAMGCSDSTTSSTSAGSGGQGGSGGTAVTTSGAGGVGGMGGEGGVGGAAGGGGAGGGSADVKPAIVPISAAGHDRFFGVTFDPKGNIYAAGTVADSTDAAADVAMLVAKFLPSGMLDESFGSKGVAIHNVAAGTNGEVARGIVVQSTGKIVIAGTVEHEGAADPRDRDIAALRLNADGTLDTSFGKNGLALIDLSEGEVVGSNYVADSHWGLSLYPNDDLLITGAQKAPGRTDTDFAVVRLTANGEIDAAFGEGGVTLLDINEQGASPRTATILPDGSAVVAGYTRDLDDVVSPVLFKVTNAGELDMSFGKGGVFNEIVLASVTEAYGATLQGTSFVTAGYGRNDASESLDWVSLRVTPDGDLDATYGMSGVARVDVAGFNDNARALSALPDGRVLLVGGGRPTADDVDAMIGVLTPDGQPDSIFAANGWKLFDLGGASDFFWGVALSPDTKVAAIVGSKGVGMGPGNDDAALLLLPLGE